MILFSYIVLNIIVIVLFIKKRTKLHLLEILVYWMIGSYLFQNLSALCYMNFKTLVIPDKLSYEFSHFLNRTILYPALMVMFIHFFLILRTYTKKILLLLCFVSILVGVEWVEHFSHILIHEHWKLWWSFAFWTVALLVLIGFMKFFRKILYKGE